MPDSDCQYVYFPSTSLVRILTTIVRLIAVMMHFRKLIRGSVLSTCRNIRFVLQNVSHGCIGSFRSLQMEVTLEEAFAIELVRCLSQENSLSQHRALERQKNEWKICSSCGVPSNHDCIGIQSERLRMGLIASDNTFYRRLR